MSASKNSISIEASRDAVAALLFDPTTYASWSTSTPSAKVLASDAQGRPTKVEMDIKAGPVKDHVSLDYEWSDADTLNFTLDEADMLTEMHGTYSIKDNGDDSVTVTYELTVGLSMPVPAMMRQKQEMDTINKTLQELKAKAEA
jgi:hypothetical protein